MGLYEVDQSKLAKSLYSSQIKFPSEEPTNPHRRLSMTQLIPFFKSSISHFLCILTFSLLSVSILSLSFFFSFSNFGLRPLGYEQLLGSWIPFLDSTPFHPSFGFASWFLIHPLEKNHTSVWDILDIISPDSSLNGTWT